MQVSSPSNSPVATPSATTPSCSKACQIATQILKGVVTFLSTTLWTAGALVALSVEALATALVASIVAVGAILGAPWIFCSESETRNKVVDTALSILSEMLAVMSVTALYPLDLTWFDPKPAPANKTPIILVHGYLDTSSSWFYIWYRLRQADVGPIYTINLGPTFMMSIEECAQKLRSKLEQIEKDTGRSDIRLYGHSMGGVVNEYYVKHIAPQGTVVHRVTFASPLQGTTTTSMGVGRCTQQMTYQSPFMQELNSIQHHSPSLHFWTRGDAIVRPVESAKGIGGGTVQNHELRRHGHLSVFFSREAADILVSRNRTL